MKEKAIKYLSAILSPIVKELPFFAFSFLLLGERALRTIHSQIVEPSHKITVVNMAGQITIVFLMAYLLTLIVSTVGKRWLKTLFYAVIIVLFFFTQFLLFNFDMKINPQALVLLAETDSREASGFLDVFLFSKGSIITYVATATTILLVCFAERWYHRKGRRTSTPTLWKALVALPVTAVLIYGASACKCYQRIFSYKTNDQVNNQEPYDWVYPSDPISLLAQSIYSLHLSSQETGQALANNMDIARHHSTITESDSLNVVLIIGESFNKWHSNLYGYPLNTMPRLKQEAETGHLTAFDDAVTSFCLTSPSMKNILCCNSYSDGEEWWESPYMPAIFKSAGYQVYFWDNQKQVKPFSEFTFSINSFIYNKNIMDMSYSQVNDSSYNYDFQIINSFKRSANPLALHNLVVFHLMGQHSPPRARYPHVAQLEYFTADSIHRSEPYLTREKRQLIAEYDNSTRYNDHVVATIIDLFRDKNTVMVYLSDHGEETYDYKDAFWRAYKGIDKNWLKHIHNIPFFVWYSDAYRQAHPDIVEAIRSSAGRPFAVDNLCHLLFHVGVLQTPYYKADRDVISDKFKPRRRIVEGKDDLVKADYDEVMRSK